MPSLYTPDSWCVLRIIDKHSGNIHYRIGAGWAGSYVHGRSWKINSGVTSYKFGTTAGKYPRKTVEFSGSSGSVYSCVLEQEGADWYLESVIASYIKELGEEYIQVISFKEFEIEFVPEQKS